MKIPVIFFIAVLFTVLSLNSGCRQPEGNINGIEQGLVLELTPDKKAFRAIQFRQQQGKVVFGEAIRFEMPDLAIICPENPPNPPGDSNGCECNTNSINGLGDCLNLMVTCNGVLTRTSNGIYTCEE